MGRETIRKDITAAVSAAVTTLYPKMVVEYDNRVIVDTATAQAPFLQCNIRFVDSEQRELAPDSATRYRGQIELAVAVKDGQGVAEAYKVLDALVPLLQRKALGTVRTYNAQSVRDKPHLGWVYFPSLIPFWSDQPS
jgi:hypothetical protein